MEDFYSKLEEIIEQNIKKEYDFPREKLNDYKQLLISLSTHMYNNTLTELIENYSQNIKDMTFENNLEKIFEFLNGKLETEYYLKCRVLSYVFLKLHGEYHDANLNANMLNTSNLLNTTIGLLILEDEENGGYIDENNGANNDEPNDE
jgi:hypothetical protein